MIKMILKRSAPSFSISAICGLLVNLLIEAIVRQITGMERFNPFSPEFMALFPSETIATEVNILLYGLIGASFAAGTFIFEKESLSFLVQNVIYVALTGICWVPVLLFVWQLQKYPQALTGTLLGYLGSYVIISVISYKKIQRDIADINRELAGMEENDEKMRLV